ncbi:MAG: glycosyltransferase [Kiritimatiellia bacterium]|jgi:glycosyltransferase involved in cell wall biosynthesis|nr:glycosyltransferase [Kiritimatiellia bacterium]
MSRDVATIAIYPEEGKSHSSAHDLSALAAYTQSLLHALPEEARKQHVVLTNLKTPSPHVFLDQQIEIHEVWKKGTLTYFFHILRRLRTISSLRIVHLQHEFNQFGGTATLPFIPLMLGIIRFFMRCKVVVTLHEVFGKDLLDPALAGNYCLPIPVALARPLFKLYYRILSCVTDEFIVQHPRIEQVLREEMGVKTPSTILPIGTETHVVPADRENAWVKYGIPPGRKLLMFFGTLDWRKGLDVLLDAFEQLPSGEYFLLIGGGQPVRIQHRPEYITWHAKLMERVKANPAIRHIGFVPDDDLPLLFAAADLVVLPYVVPQIMSAVINHAASYERPFIGSDAFNGQVDPVALFQATPDDLTRKIQWAFAEGKNRLIAYSLRYKTDHAWERGARIMLGAYARALGKTDAETDRDDLTALDK